MFEYVNYIVEEALEVGGLDGDLEPAGFTHVACLRIGTVYSIPLCCSAM